jgi:NAD(P)H-hydrate epimerase
VGAAYLAAQAAVRSGTGLVTLATPLGVYPIAAAKLTEVIHLPLAEDDAGRVHSQAAGALRAALPRYQSLVVGSGLGWSEGTRSFLAGLLLAEPRPALPLLLDADGLNNLSQLDRWWEKLGNQTVLTPHPGELATLTGLTTAEVQRDRLATARRWSEAWGVTLVLKGAHTIIAAPGQPARFSPFANPGLASGGTGDVLTGIVGGLLAQGLPPPIAAACGVYLHGQAAAMVSARHGSVGLVASDLLDALPETMLHLLME